MFQWLFVSLLAMTGLSAEVINSSVKETKVLAFSGSTRSDSFNKKLVVEAAELARHIGAKVTIIDLKDFSMPFYDGDLELDGMPESAKKFRALMIESDAILIASPEYNHSFSAILKNALDWASRNEEGKYSTDAFQGKRFAIMSASPGKSGGRRGLTHLREIIEDLGGDVVSTQVSVGRIHEVVASPEGLKVLSVKEPLEQELYQLLNMEKTR